jgi:hypothetical protein
MSSRPHLFALVYTTGLFILAVGHLRQQEQIFIAAGKNERIGHGAPP